MAQALKETHFDFPAQRDQYSGKVRDVYNINEQYLVIVATDRISAFDHILPQAIPGKGQVLNQVSTHFFDAIQGLVPTHFVSAPDPNVTIALKCKPILVEVVVRGYLAGHAWREYRDGKRELCGVALPEGMKEGDRFPEPIVTPATKSLIGHDEDISEREILASGLLDPEEWGQIKRYALDLFAKGTEIAGKRGLLLVDTKYEFGTYEDDVYLIDEVHTPDSSRYYHAAGYEARQAAGESQQQLSKEFVREWLMLQGFQGQVGQAVPEMPEAFVQEVSQRYIELYETMIGRAFAPYEGADLHGRIERNVSAALKQLIE